MSDKLSEEEKNLCLNPECVRREMKIQSHEGTGFRNKEDVQLYKEKAKNSKLQKQAEVLRAENKRLKDAIGEKNVALHSDGKVMIALPYELWIELTTSDEG